MSGSESTLPRTFPLWAFLALLGNVLLSLLKLIVHGLWLAPQCIAAAVRRRRGDPAPAPEPGLEFYEGKVNHTRLWPVFHTFTYPVRASEQRGCCSGRTCREAPSSTGCSDSLFAVFLLRLAAMAVQVRNVLVDLDAPPEWFARQLVRLLV
jgi:hypothetical protein